MWIVKRFSLVRNRRCQARKRPSFRAGSTDAFTTNAVPAASPVGGGLQSGVDVEFEHGGLVGWLAWSGTTKPF